MRFLPLATSTHAAFWVANYIAKKINHFAPTAERPFVLGLPTGSTPLPVYQYLIGFYQQQEISFEHVVTFNMDEYIGLPPSHPQSYHFFMHQHFFNQVNLQPANINLLDGQAADLTKECLCYEQKIQSYGGIQLFLGGVGTNGHLAFNEPHSDFTSRTRIVNLSYKTRQDNARFFDSEINNVPSQALSIGVATLMDAKEIVILATGASKAKALQAALRGSIDPQWIISALQLHPKVTLVSDKEATLALTPETIHYFKQREQTTLNEIEKLTMTNPY